MLQGKKKPKTGRMSGVFGKKLHDVHKIMIIVDDQSLPILEKIAMNTDWGYQIIYVLTDSEAIKTRFQYRSRIYSIGANIRSLLRHDIVDEIVCCSVCTKKYMEELAIISVQYGVSLLMLPACKPEELFTSQSRFIGNFEFSSLESNPRNKLTYAMKTSMEILFAFCALFVLSPFLVFISILIKSTSDGPVLFKQIRVGLRGRQFYIYKFRTMVINAEKLKAALMEYNETDGPAFKIRNDPRITGLGKFLRKTGLDEIPQLFNVMRGEMTLIGPRPMLPKEVLAHEEWQLKRLSIKPGITCSWQVQPNRNSVSFDNWMRLDRDYVENWSVGNDIRLFFKTIKSIFAAKGM